MGQNNFELSMKKAWTMFLKGEDFKIYRDFEGNQTSMDDFKDKVYRINYYIFVLVLIICLFNAAMFIFLFLSFLWYKPLCHAIHLRNRTKRYNVIQYAASRGLDS
jgi:hypothetical protein